MTELDQLLARAQALSDERDWANAAMHFTQAAQRAEQSGEGELARRIWDLAGEAWRRDDHPQAAARALRAALTLSSGEVEALASIKLSAVLGELGRVEEAIRWARKGLVGRTALLARDTLVGHFLARGDVAEARRWVPPAVDGPMGSAHFFRVAQLARMDGAFDEAEAALDAAMQRLEGVPGAESGRAAARAERVEIRLLTDRPTEAIGLAEEALAEHRAAGRRAMAWRAEAARVRALVAAEVAAPPTLLDPGLGFARVRELPLLEADLLLARAELDPARTADDLHRVLALGTGSWIRDGRAHLLLARHLRDPDHAAQAVACLAPSRPWHDRAVAVAAELSP